MGGRGQAERRGHRRVALALDAGLEIVGEEQAVAAIVEDASLSGVRLRCFEDLPPGTQAFLVIELPDHLPIAAIVESVACTGRAADGLARSHLAIRRMSDASRARLAALLAGR